jgi:glycosyltransferase involved in cell wall biosynthesis
MGMEVLALEPDPIAKNSIEAGYVPLPVAVSGGSLARQGSSWFIRAVRRGIQAARESPFDVIYATNNNIFNLVVSFTLSGILALPCIAVVHHLRWVDYREPSDRLQVGKFDASLFFKFLRDEGVSLGASWTRLIGGFVESKLLSRFDGFIVVSTPVASQLGTLVQPNKIFVVGNAPFNSRSSVRSVADTSMTALFVGRIDEGKGIAELMKAWKNVVVQCPQAHLDVVGNGSLRQHMISEAQRCGLDKNLQFRGFLDDSEIMRLQSQSRFFITLSRTEGFGMAIAEALAAGLPAIAWDTPPLREIFGECPSVFLCNQGNIGEIVATSVKLFTIAEDHWSALSSQASNYSHRFSWEDAAQKEISAIEEVVRRRRSNR